MLKKIARKCMAFFMLLSASTGFLSGQLKTIPTISQVDGSQQFVIVLKGANADKVLMGNGKASTFDFTPNDLNSYPTWRIKRIKVVNSNESYIALQNAGTLEFFAFGKAGDNKMISEEEYNKMFERDQSGVLKYTIDDMKHFAYWVLPDSDKKHFTLGYRIQKGQIGFNNVWMAGWPSQKMRLVLVSIN